MTIALDAVQALLRSAHELKENYSAQLLGEVHRLLQSCSVLRREHQSRARDQAPDHNLIRLLGLERSEVGLHSCYLADLLNPFGSHGQGGLFLQRFLDILAEHVPELSLLVNGAAENTSPWDWIVNRERERIDIAVRNRRLGLLIFIENKFDAGEQDQQLARYRARLDRQSDYQYRLLLYLSPQAHGPPQSGTPDVRITYEEDIVRWLRRCEQDIHAKHVMSNLRQYVDIISHLSDEVNMPYQEELISLLCEREHIGTTLEIDSVIWKVKPRLQSIFWQTTERCLSESLQKRGLDTRWHLERHLDPIKEPKKNDAGLRCVLRGLKSGVPHLHTTIGTYDQSLYVGVGFIYDRPVKVPGEVNRLAKNLQQNQFTIEQDNWIAWRDIGINIDRNEFFIDVASDPVLVADRAIEPLLDLLNKHGAEVEAAEIA